MQSAVTKHSESYKFVVSYFGCSRNFFSHRRSQSQIEKGETMKKYGKTQAEGQQALPCAFFDLFDLRNLGITGLFNTKFLRDFCIL